MDEQEEKEDWQKIAVALAGVCSEVSPCPPEPRNDCAKMGEMFGDDQCTNCWLEWAKKEVAEGDYR